MSRDMAEEKNNLFEDYYKTDSFDDNNELQARLYSEIYHDSNESESRTVDTPKTIRFDRTVSERNIESMRLQCQLEKQLLVPKSAGDSQKILCTNQTEFNQVHTLAGELNPVPHKSNNESPGNSSATQGNENRKNSSKKYKFLQYCKNAINEYQKKKTNQKSSKENHNDAVYSKYNVDLKCIKKQKLLAKQTDENESNSDSEESIFEVPVPPKPIPPLIDLQDSDEENNINSGIDKDDLILKKWDNIASIKTYSRINHCRSPELEIIETSNNHQNISSKNNSTDRSYNNNISLDKSIQISTCVQETAEDIILNCTPVQRGAKSVNEIKQSSKSVVNQENKSIEDINQNGKRKLLQNKSKGNNENNTNLHEEIPATLKKNSQMKTQQNDQRSICKVSLVRLENQIKKSRLEAIMGYNTRKRQCNNEVNNYPKQKRQCTLQQNNQDVIQGNNDKEKSNTSNEHFKPMPEEMRNYYNLSRGQEDFNIGELQQGMSRDPRLWKILDEDIMPCPSSRRTRFWNVKCTNCHQDGHQRYDCSSPRKTSCCYMCGMTGHTESRCPKKMCLTCGKKQNTFRNTCEHCRVLYCTMCHSIGHELEQCPDLWRRYHQTTDMNSAPQDPGNVMKSSRLLYCCNCAKRGHESSTCREYRWSEHFPTPAAVINYTDGPTYTPCTPSSSTSNPETNFLSSEMTENETAIPQNITNVQYTIIKDVESSVNVDTLSSNINFCIQPTSQETITQMEESLKSSYMANKIWSTVKTSLRQTEIKPVTFNSITYTCGNFHKKDHKDARMILKNLNTFFQNRKSMLNNLINRDNKVTPVFLKTLFDAAIEFEVKIGFTTRRNLSLQLLAMKEYIEYLYDLIEYWLNLPDDEKSDGIDVTLPRNPIKMFNVLNSRMPQLEKMQFTCYANHIGGINDPRWLYNCIENEKAKLKGKIQKYEGSLKKYNNSRKRLWRLQVKFLMIVNTEPQPNVLVCTFRDVMKRFESERHHMGQKLDPTTYLRFILLYNQLFVPHTPDNIYKTFYRFQMEENQNKNNSLQMQQESEITREQENLVREQENLIREQENLVREQENFVREQENLVREQENFVHEQENLVYNDIYSPSTSSYTAQNIDFEHSSAINNQQNEILIEEQNVNNILLEINETPDYNYEIITTSNFSPRSSQVMPLNIELMSAESEDSRRNEDQLSTSEVNVKSNTHVNKQNVNYMTDTYLTKKQRKKLQKSLNIITPKNIYNKAFELIKKARKFKLPHMMNAADEMQRQINNQTIRSKHVQTLFKLILLQERYQKDVNTYCRNLKQ